MGVPLEDTGKVGELIGTKVFINEFVGYANLGPMIRNGEIQVGYPTWDHCRRSENLI